MSSWDKIKMKNGLVVEELESPCMTGTIDDVIDLLKSKKKQYAKTHTELELEIVYSRYDEGDSSLVLKGLRPPTAEEQAKWDAQKAEEKAQQEAWERKDLKRLEELRKKYPEE